MLSLVAATFAAGGCLINWDDYEPLPISNGAGGEGAGGDAPSNGGNGAGTSSGGSGGSGGTAHGGEGGSGGGPPTDACGKTELLTDDFSDGTMAGFWSSDTAAATGGEIVFTLPIETESWSGLGTYRAFDFTDTFASIEVPVMVDTSSTAEAFFSIVYEGSSLTISERNGDIRASSYMSTGEWNLIASKPYDPVEHRFWQIREAAGMLYFELSADGANWTELESVPSGGYFPLEYVHIEFGATTEGTEMTPGEAHFDNLNGGTPSDMSWCPIETLKDDFDDGTKALVWSASYANGPCDALEENGELVLRTSSGASSECAYMTGPAFDLSNGQLSVHVTELATNVESHYAFLRIEENSSHGVSIVFADGQLRMKSEQGAGEDTVALFVYDPAEHAYWRLSDQGTGILFETSSDGVNYVAVATTDTMPFDITRTVVMLGAGDAGMLLSPGSEAHMDDLNIARTN